MSSTTEEIFPGTYAIWVANADDRERAKSNLYELGWRSMSVTAEVPPTVKDGKPTFLITGSVVKQEGFTILRQRVDF